MYFLSSDRAVLHYFSSPDDVDHDGSYAILSHVWEKKGEQTFEEVQTIAKKCNEDGTNPRDFVSDKIRQCCILAEKHGYRWIWNDTCCIDKRSSSELSEAINSMFRYYALAKVCYAYLHDVPSDYIHDGNSFAFWNSRWHSRGWTLQELIAPKFLIFVSMDWQSLSTRTELADELEGITNVPARLLKRETKVRDYSVAERMSWAARRKTTREEDQAYSLMGLFGIHMPTLYGEGWNAFRRLQEEIMKQSVDPSLFLWGRICLLSQERLQGASVACNHHYPFSYLLASSPSVFVFSSGIEFIPFLPFDVVAAQTDEPGSTESQAAISNSSVTFNSTRLPTFTSTPYGVQAHLPIVQSFRGGLLAILPCYLEGKRLGLILSPCMHPSDPSRPLYHTSLFGDRVFIFDDIQSLSDCYGGHVAVEWKEVYITSSPPNVRGMVSELPTPLINTMLPPPFRIPETSIRELSWEGGYAINPVSSTSVPWTGAPHIAVIFRRDHTDEFMAILLGRCGSRIEDTGDRDCGRLGSHWVAVRFYTSEDQALKLKAFEHACPGDHVGPDGEIRVQDPHLPTDYIHEPLGTTESWVLSFTRCRISPSTTLLVNIRCLKS